MTKTEEVARAILAAAQKQTWAFSEDDPKELTNVMLDGQFDLLELARAAIQALRTPTPAMLRAGGHPWHKADPHDAAELVWERMCDAAGEDGE